MIISVSLHKDRAYGIVMSMIKGHRASGFSIVELLVMIAVIGLLATITVFAFGSWRQRTAVTEVKNDLQAAAVSLKNTRNFDNAYPANQAALLANYQPSRNVTLTYTLRGGGTSYCLKAQSTADPGVVYYIDSAITTVPTTTACS